MNGVVDENLVPIFPVSFMKEYRDWQQISLLLDTGFDGEIALDAALLRKYALATRPNQKSLTPEMALETHDSWGPRVPYTGELLWWGHPRISEIRLLAAPAIKGMLGTKLLMYHLLTLDAAAGGTVTLASGAPPRQGSGRWWEPRERERRRPSPHDLEEFLWNEHPDFLESYLLWTSLQVQDAQGRFHPIWVNVDTGNNQDLCLPAKWLARLGLASSGRCLMNTPEGVIETDQGEAAVIWQDRKRKVHWSQLLDGKPPLIGMNLMKGNRITIHFDLPRPTVHVWPIPQSGSTGRGFLNALIGRHRP